jgi:DNA-binding transcriptional LysR family regulator
MKLTLDALQALDAIARNGSFARAAAELHRVPSALTYTMQQLEATLDVALFSKDGRRSTLSAAGHELLNEGRILLKAAADLECRIQQIAKGWETELRIAVDTIIGIRALYPLVAQFEAEQSGTRIKLLTEVFGGTWDALISERADLVIGASTDVPTGGGYAMLPLGTWQWGFVASPKHPITREKRPLTEATILRYRAVSVADSSRLLPPRTMGLINGQDVLTVPTMRDKLNAHIAGLGVGFLPKHLAAPEIKAKRLVTIDVVNPRVNSDVCVAWRANRTGRAQRWFIQQLEKSAVAKSILLTS